MQLHCTSERLLSLSANRNLELIIPKLVIYNKRDRERSLDTQNGYHGSLVTFVLILLLPVGTFFSGGEAYRLDWPERGESERRARRTEVRSNYGANSCKPTLYGLHLVNRTARVLSAYVVYVSRINNIRIIKYYYL